MTQPCSAVLALTLMQRPPQQGHRLDQLLITQGETILRAQEQAELLALMPIDQ
jgi:hypothetical protein